ncbi:MAG: hypothetical protein ACLQBJ_01380 [Bryobacteraceae bacterium]
MDSRFNPAVALEELRDDAVLPNPVRVRDMILRTGHTPEQALDLNRKFTAYQQAFAEAQGLAAGLLAELTLSPSKM